MGLHLPAPGGDDFREISEINVTPFIDVILVLLVVFMIAVPVSVAYVPVHLPVSHTEPDPPPPRPVIVSIRADGSVYLAARLVPPGGLDGALAAAARPDSLIFLQADKQLPYGGLMAVLDQLRAGGYMKVSLVSQAAPAGP